MKNQVEPALNEVEAGRFLGLAHQSMANLRVERATVYYKLGYRIVYKISDLERYLAERRIDPEARRGEVGLGRQEQPQEGDQP